MKDRYIVQVRRRKNGKWNPVDSFDNEADAIQQCGFINRSAKAGEAEHRVWSQSEGKQVYSRGWCDSK